MHRMPGPVRSNEPHYPFCNQLLKQFKAALGVVAILFCDERYRLPFDAARSVNLADGQLHPGHGGAGQGCCPDHADFDCFVTFTFTVSVTVTFTGCNRRLFTGDNNLLDALTRGKHETHQKKRY